MSPMSPVISPMIPAGDNNVWGFTNHSECFCDCFVGTQEEYDEFLKSLDFNYDSGYGTQELFGRIWYRDGSWSERYEYDGSENWDYKSRPEIPTNLNRIDKIREEKLNQIL